jgi:uncharacterized protein YndB with AHSA1/START domain
MNIELKSDFPLTDEACKQATGKSFGEWYAVLDEQFGPNQGRRPLTNHLYNELKVDIWWCSAIVSGYEAHHGIKEKDGRAKGYFICSTKTLNAPLEKVYAAWASQDALRGWLSDDVKAEVKDGGQFASGSAKGEFKRVRENKDLRLAWVGPSGDESIVDVQLSDKGKGKTGLLVNHDRLQTREEADGMRRAWGEALDRLKAKLEG